LTQHIDELRTAFPIAGLTLANGHRTFSKVMGFARAQPILRATGCSCAVASPLNSSADKEKTPVGSGRFRSQLGGSWGLL